MTPESITLCGFKSFKSEQTFKFPQKVGYYFISGDNQAEPELEGNGVGKSALLEAITWVIFGKTSRNLRGEDDLKTWDEQVPCFVKFSFSLYGDTYTIQRTQSPNSLKFSKNGSELEPIDQDDIVKIIPLDFESFLYSVIFSQTRDAFFDLTPADKTKLFTSVLPLSVWDDSSKRASAYAAELESGRQDTEKFIAECKGSLSSLKEFNIDDKIDQWQQQHEAKSERLKIEINQLNQELEQHREDAQIHQVSLKKASDQRERILKELEELKPLVIEVEDIYQSLRDEKTKTSHEITSIRRLIDKMDGLEGVCSNCRQPISEEHKQVELKQFNTRLREHQKSLKTIEHDLEELTEDRQELQTVIAELNVAKQKHEFDLRQVNQSIEYVKQLVSRAVVRQKTLKQEQRQMRLEENPYLKEKQQLQDKISALEDGINKSQQELTQIETRLQAAKYWVKGFKEVRLYMISEVLTQLEVETNNALFELGLRNWRVEFAVDQETKKGTIRKGFNVLIYSPYNSKPVKWECWSGGESQRLRLAGSVGLANLILARVGFESGFEVYDEPTRWLSTKGVQDVVELLGQRTRDCNKSIFLVDHKNLESNQFDGIFKVIKDQNGSRVEVIH